MSPRYAFARFLLQRIKEADLSVGAAAVAYNAFLALVPLALAFVGVAAIVGSDAAAVSRLERTLAPIAPDDVIQFVVDLMTDADTRVGGGSPWLIAGSVLVALFLGSRAVVALQRSLAVVGKSIESRPAVQMRVVGIGLTVAGGLSLLVVSTLLIAGRFIFTLVGDLVGWSGIVSLWAWARVPVAALGLYAFVRAFYAWGPPEPVPRGNVASSVAVAGIVLGSLGFGWYLAAAPTLGATFGALGAVAIAMVWLYLGSLSILVGGVVAYAVDERG